MAAPDDREFTEYVQASSARLRRTVFLVCGDWHKAEDAVQQAMERLYLNWSRLEHGPALDSYVRTTALRWLIDQSRRPWRRERVHEVLPDKPAPEHDQADAITVRGALARVPLRQRATIVLRYYDGYDVAETARLLGCSEGTVKSQTARGLATLRELLGEAGFSLTTTTTKGL